MWCFHILFLYKYIKSLISTKKDDTIFLFYEQKGIANLDAFAKNQNMFVWNTT